MTDVAQVAGETVVMADSEVPDDIAKAMDFLGRMAAAYGGRLKWNEKARLKADMMNVRPRWWSSRITPAALRAECERVGLSAEDTALVLDYLSKAQSGKRMVPHATYRTFKFHPLPPSE